MKRSQTDSTSARTIAPVVSVQNFYTIANREDDDLIDALAAPGIAYVPYFPLGRVSAHQSDVLAAVAPPGVTK